MCSAKPIAPALSDFDIKLTGLLNMKKTLIASIIMGGFALSATMPSVAAPTSIGYAPSIDGTNIVIGIKGQDESNKVYDLDAMDNTLSANQSTLNQHTANIATNKVDIAKNKSAIIDVQSDIKKVQTTSSYAQSRADAAYANTETNRKALQATNHRVADNSAAIADHEQRIEKLESSNSANFGKLKNEVDDNRQRASAAISGVAAMANIPQVIQGQTFSVGAGVGTTDGESALAVGFSARAAEHVVVKASVSDDTQQNFVVGGGVSYGW